MEGADLDDRDEVITCACAACRKAWTDAGKGGGCRAHVEFDGDRCGMCREACFPGGDDEHCDVCEQPLHDCQC